MVRCRYCQRKTKLYDGDMPVCLDCANRPEAKRQPSAERNIVAILQRELEEATARAHQATDAFNATMGDIPSALPRPDGTQRINNVYRELSLARREMMEAHSRLSDYLASGILPEGFDTGGGR